MWLLRTATLRSHLHGSAASLSSFTHSARHCLCGPHCSLIWSSRSFKVELLVIISLVIKQCISLTSINSTANAHLSHFNRRLSVILRRFGHCASYRPYGLLQNATASCVASSSCIYSTDHRKGKRFLRVICVRSAICPQLTIFLAAGTMWATRAHTRRTKHVGDADGNQLWAWSSCLKVRL